MLATGPDRELYELCRACRGVLNLLLEELKGAGNLDAWNKILAARSPEADGTAWLEAFYGKTAQYLRVPELFYSPVLPNQYGRFCAPADLKLDKIGDEELKAISVSFRGNGRTAICPSACWIGTFSFRGGICPLSG